MALQNDMTQAQSSVSTLNAAGVDLEDSHIDHIYSLAMEFVQGVIKIKLYNDETMDWVKLSVRGYKVWLSDFRQR